MPQASSSKAPRRCDWDRLLGHWLDRYPGPGGVQTHWNGLAPLSEQTHAACELLSRHHQAGSGAVLVSGEVAADHLTPWGRPVRSIVYTQRGEDLRKIRLTPCLPEEATMTLIVPQDPAVWLFASRWWATPGRKPQPPGLPLADPLQILADLRSSPTIDTDQTAQRLRHRLGQEVRATRLQSGEPDTDDLNEGRQAL